MSLTDFPDADESWQVCDAGSAPVSEANQKILEQRWSDYCDGKLRRISFEELEDRLGKDQPV